jgi:hypothetical protein
MAGDFFSCGVSPLGTAPVVFDQVAISVYNALVAQYQAQAEVYKVEAEVYATRIQAELAKLQAYGEELRAHVMGSDFELNVIKVWRLALNRRK